MRNQCIRRREYDFRSWLWFASVFRNSKWLDNKFQGFFIKVQIFIQFPYCVLISSQVAEFFICMMFEWKFHCVLLIFFIALRFWMLELGISLKHVLNAYIMSVDISIQSCYTHSALAACLIFFRYVKVDSKNIMHISIGFTFLIRWWWTHFALAVCCCFLFLCATYWLCSHHV